MTDEQLKKMNEGIDASMKYAREIIDSIDEFKNTDCEKAYEKLLEHLALKGQYTYLCNREKLNQHFRDKLSLWTSLLDKAFTALKIKAQQL